MSVLNALTCLTCRVTFSSANLQRDHYKVEWHGYNLKRKLALLPAVTYEQFERIQEQHLNRQDQEKSLLNKSKSEKSFYCDLCHKQFNNENAFAQHMQSKKHNNATQTRSDIRVKALKKKQTDELSSPSNSLTVENKSNQIEDQIEKDYESSDSDWESVDSNEDNDVDEDDAAIPPNNCLFCDNSSDNINDNMSHMSVKHSFFVPDIEYLVDLEKLIRYLGEKIGSGHCCLWCGDNGKQFHSKKSAQQHMTDKGHTKMKFQQSGDALLEYSEFYDYSSSYPDSNEKELNADEEILIPNLEDEDWQLTLPSGAVIGHRSLFRYYKQNLKPLPESGLTTKSSAILGKVMSQYRALGWTGTTGEAAVQKAKDIKFIQRIQRRHELKMGQKNNRLMQTHFRSQIGF